MSAFLHDLRLAVRGLSRRPLFAITAAATVAIGIAGNTAIFSAVHAVLLRPLPYHEPGRLVTLDVNAPTGFYISLSIPNYVDWQARNRSFETFGASAGWGMVLTGRGPAEIVGMRVVLGEFFETLGVPAVHGRTIDGAATGPGAEPVVVLGYAFWQRHFGGKADVLGESLVLDGLPYTIVGVMPEGFGYPSSETELYVPMGVLAPTLPWDERESSFGTRAIARLAPAVSLERAREDMRRVGREVEELEGQAVAQPEVRWLADLLIGEVRAQLWILMGAVVLVLLVVCANVGNLLLARGEDRRREVAVRTALGAGRVVLVRQILAESLAIALFGGALGVALAFPALRLLVPLLPSEIPSSVVDGIEINVPVLLFALALTVFTGLFFGLIPALRISQHRLIGELRAAGHGDERSRHRLRAALVVAEVALALVLLIGSGLMVQSLNHLRNANVGFDADGVLTARFALPDERYPDKESWRAFYMELVERVQAVPGVESAAATLLLPLTDRSWEMRILPEGVPFVRDEAQSVLFGIVSPEYFQTLGVPLVRGRGFTDGDRDGTDLVAIIDETMAERFFPGEDPIGKRVAFELAEGSNWDDPFPVPVYRTVIGVAKNVRHYELASPSRIQVYIPYTQTTQRFWGMGLYVIARTSLPPASLAEPIRQQLAAIDPDVPMFRVAPMQEYVESDLSGNVALSTLMAVFGIVALLLAAMGIFAVISYSVIQRTREIGIRMALGAEGTKVVRWIARQGVALCAVGIVIGIAGAIGLSRLLTAFLYEVSPLEPGIYALVAGSLLVVSALASYLPARRATRVDPVSVLKQQ